MRNVNCLKSHRQQRGIVTAIAAILLFTAVLFVLSQTYGIIGTNSNANQSQADSTAAAFLAESGLERAVGILNSAGSTITGSTCNNIATNYLCGTGSLSLGNGRTYCYAGTPIASPNNSCSGGNCNACTVTVTGNAGSASRTISLKIKLSAILGISGTGGYASNPPACTLPANSPIQLLLKNNYNGQYPGTAIFSLGILQHSTGNPVNPLNCGSTTELFFVSSSQGAGQDSIFGYSDYAKVALNQATVPSAIHGFSKSENYSLVGAIFPNANTADTTPIGTYWNASSSSNSTVFKNNTPSSPYIYTGYTNSGVAGGVTVCTAPDLNHENTKQACTQWCMDADTLVYNFAANSTGISNSLNDVKFDTGDNTHQNKSLTYQVHFPGSSATGTATDVYSDIWYLYNNRFSVPSDSVGATSFTKAVYGSTGANVTGTVGATVSGAIGATFVGSAGSGNKKPYTTSSTLTVKNNTICTNCSLSPGDAITGGLDANLNPITTYVASLSGTSTSGNITVTFPIYASNNTNFTSTSNCLNVNTASVTGSISLNDTVAGTTINSTSAGTCIAVSNATSYQVLAKVNAVNTTQISSTKLIASAIINGQLTVGDSIAGTTINSLNLLDGKTSGTYILSNPVKDTTGTLTDASTTLIGTYATSSSLTNGIINNGNGTSLSINVSSGPTSNNYSLSAVSTYSPRWFTQGTSGTVITVPTGTAIPITGTTIAVYSGTGKLAANTTVLSTPAPTATSFTVSASPTTALNSAIICGGICAFFNLPSSTVSTTEFKITASGSGTKDWTSGFTCLKGVLADKIYTIPASTTTTTSTWHELIQ